MRAVVKGGKNYIQRSRLDFKTAEPTGRIIEFVGLLMGARKDIDTPFTRQTLPLNGGYGATQSQ